MANRAGSLTDLMSDAAAPLAPIIADAAKAAWSPAGQLCKAFAHRRHVAALSGLDDRMLCDIGLTRNDVRDAIRQPLWRDPIAVLASRAGEGQLQRYRSRPTRWCKARPTWNPRRVEVSTMDKVGA